MKKYISSVVKVGPYKLGGNNPVRVQSMCNTDTRDVKATVKQILALEKVGCEIVRVAVLDMEAARAISKIKKQIHIPLVADIHFDYKLALEAVAQGIDKIRINPGNIGSEEKVKAVVMACKKKKIPIRIGINGGSLEKEILKKYKNKVTAEGMVESAMRHIKILERYNFKDILISLKASDIKRTVEAYRLLSKKVNYPLHIGVTEAGTIFRGTIMSSIGLGILLYDGIGATLRVSLTADPVEEIGVAWEILKSLEKRKKGVTVTSCPTCGRTQIDLINLAKKVEEAVKNMNKDIHIAVMGCVVNGPGEAREADIGVAGGKGMGAIFVKGKVIKSVKEDQILSALLEEIEKIK
ncbi:MAG: 4-hydroxy-3-methylbut-2-en-1-yl diphosphate synthase [Candidatus Moranbacteria bacterium RIFOXYA12_FULL_35_19]|nr:MAG: 4-hydroxy-3-methylbut-2-en-1-yl diphosphate synthase [Candidatus Moranbacteria bacterium RIFOXYB12_FULL_35_8]OGI33269.1 MAG: 4-hydroxy-3-methylbut-2-en-1-yl diphosphate synthase [Candidatus Moranbacteria bacterium RIFOXYC12_FULL_36_13]OGI36459.1 MAG: 4-hydroxy-3-methylbut-2-en-1-yl diphosphate synthase [Candidatus Moranbacteria bacterium RIFOXYA12_FULL_35_19]